MYRYDYRIAVDPTAKESAKGTVTTAFASFVYGVRNQPAALRHFFEGNGWKIARRNGVRRGIVQMENAVLSVDRIGKHWVTPIKRHRKNARKA